VNPHHVDADPDFYLMRIPDADADPTFHLMRFRILFSVRIRIRPKW
jgi:hypothetical protein